jgi:AraC family transcriptional regulator
MDARTSMAPSYSGPIPAEAANREPHAHGRAAAPPVALERGLSRRALQRACSFIEQRLGERLSLQEIADAACVSRFHFARMFRLSTGRSPIEYLFHRRIERARHLLLEGDRLIGEVAAELGFSDQSHFSRHFRRATGLSPSAYLRQRDDRFDDPSRLTFPNRLEWRAAAHPQPAQFNQWAPGSFHAQSHDQATGSTPVLSTCTVSPDAGLSVRFSMAAAG